MMPDEHTTTDGHPPMEQGESLLATPLTPLTPPTPSSDTTVARLQRTPSSGRQVLGIGLAVLAGAASVAFGNWVSLTVGASVPYFLYLAIRLVPDAVVALICAWLLRTWWSLLTIPALFLLGYLIGAVVDLAMSGSFYSLGYALQYMALGLLVFVEVELLPLLVGTAIGTAIGMYGARRGGIAPHERQSAT